jgi:hypothetical protein
MTLEGRALLSTFTVDSTADDGSAGTLRWAVVQANDSNQVDTIVFSSLFNTPQTIKLTGFYNPLTLSDFAATTITGPGASLLTVSGNSTSPVFVIDGSASLTGLTITGGNGPFAGGLNASGGATTLSNCTISGNSGTYGGGLSNAQGTLALSNCTITGNSNAHLGGGVFNGDNGAVSLTNCTVSGNSAVGEGGGLATVSGGSLTLTNCTVYGNNNVGLVNQGSITLTNTIVAGNIGGDIAGGFTDVGGNLIGGDPMLAPLGEYGGPTPTMPLLPGSPAIGKGVSGPGSPTTDQRGLARGASVDVGAFQTQGPASLSVNVATDGLGSGLGQLNLRQAINLANVEPGDNAVSFSPSVFGTTPRTIILTAGELTLSDPAGNTINGPGADLLTVSGSNANASRVFLVQGGSAALSGLTITGGNAPVGGGLDNVGETLTLTECTITGNVAAAYGGGLVASGAATTILTDCTVSGNSAKYGGGLFNYYNGSTITLTNCNVSGNNGRYGGGLYNEGTASLTDCIVTGNSALGGGGVENKGTATLAGCTVSGNSATAFGLGGGGLDNGTSGTLSLVNCTINGNTGQASWGVGLSNSGTLSLLNCTVSGNSAGSGTGGLYVSPFDGATATLTNTIVAGNTPGDIRGALNSESANNLVGDGTGMTGISGGSQGNQVGTAAAPLNPLLAPLGDYGGPTPTMPLLPGSSAIGAGMTGAGVPGTDQRGQPRTGHVDIGAFQSQGFTFAPIAGGSPQMTLIGSSFANPLGVAVTANNPVEPIDGGQVRFAVVPAADGASATLSADSATIAGGRATVTATANATPGQYTVVATSSPSAPIDLVLTNASLVVTTTQDDLAPDGLNSLREAIAYADSLPGLNSITFDPAVFGTAPQTITLIHGPLSFTDMQTTTITGPGASLLKVSGNNASRVFEIQGGSAALSGLAITGGNAAYDGGGLYNRGGTLSLSDCTITGNTATDEGGGLFNYGGTTTLTDCAVSGNSAFRGGGLCAFGGTTTLTNATVSGNSASYSGGGLFASDGTTTLTNATVTGNSASFGGGGVLISSGTTTLTNTIVAGNTGGDVQGPLEAASGHNLVGDGTGMTGISNGSQGNQVGTAQAPIDPLLSASGDYGGPTPTMPLLPGSPAIKAGATGPGIPTTDQRGQSRTGSVDIGAFQSQGSAVAVNDTADGVGSAVGRITLRQAVNLAKVLTSAETITFDPTVFAAPQIITLTGTQLTLTNKQTTTITGPGASFLTVSGHNRSRVFEIQGGSAALSGLTITGGNSTGDGGGLYGYSGTLSLTGCIITGNSASSGGGGLANMHGGAATLTNCTVSENYDSQNGGGLLNSGTLSMTDCTVSGNSASSGGGGLANIQGGAATLSYCTFRENHTSFIGGGLLNSGTLSMTNCTVSDNRAVGMAEERVGGGGLYNAGGTLALTNCTVSRNSATGGDYLTAGGGLCNANATLSMTNCTVSGNSADQGGGLANLYGSSAATLTNCTVSGNSASAGGGLASYNSTTTLTDCTVSGNTAGAHGGGLVSGLNAMTTLTNVSISGNAAQNGGGLYLVRTGGATLTNCTVTGNTASSTGGGLFNYLGGLALTNTIVAGQYAGGDISGAVNSASANNLVGDGSGMTGISDGSQGNQIGTAQAPIAPLLASLGDYGGPTPTMPLLPGSPAISAGTSGAGIPTTDQRGQPRTGHVDIGAFQSQGFTLTAAAGSAPQTAAVGAVFANPLTVTVTALNPVEPVDGGAVRFAAPGMGASATLSAGTATIAGGQAGITATAGTIGGSYTVPASAAGATTAAGFALTNAAPPNLVAQPVAAIAGRAFINVVVATFTDSDPNANPSDFVAAIVWGDGITTSSTTVIADGQGGFDVLGTHTYVDASTYTFRVQVTGSSGANGTATSTATVTADANSEASNLVLTTRRDVVDAFDGLTSLREAIAYANRHPGPDTIRFDPAVFGKAHRTIKLTGGPLVVTGAATTAIIGPGAKLLTISGGGKSRIFDIEGGSLALSGVTIAGGNAGKGTGGALRNDGGTLWLNHVTIRGNRARKGGGLYNDGTTTLTDVVLRRNTARVGPGLFSTRRATLTWRGLWRPSSTGQSSTITSTAREDSPRT